MYYLVVIIVVLFVIALVVVGLVMDKENIQED